MRAQDQGDDTQARQLLDEALAQAQRANREVRDLVQGILPAGLARGVAVEQLIERLRVPVTVDVAPGRFRPEIEANAYFLIAEALTNVAKHSNARRATVSVWVEDALLDVEVGDDGVGGARPEGGGLRGLADRIDAFGGRLQIDSPRAGGTRCGLCADGPSSTWAKPPDRAGGDRAAAGPNDHRRRHPRLAERRVPVLDGERPLELDAGAA